MCLEGTLANLLNSAAFISDDTCFCYLLHQFVSAVVVHLKGAGEGQRGFHSATFSSSYPSKPIASVSCHVLWKPIAGSSLNWETVCWSVWLKIKAINFMDPWGHLKGHSETRVQREAHVLADEDRQGMLRCLWERAQWLQSCLEDREILPIVSPTGNWKWLLDKQQPGCSGLIIFLLFSRAIPRSQLSCL